ncbi:MAG: hypothetical protein ACP5L2_07690, partial [Conexivisphaera sp.]
MNRESGNSYEWRLPALPAFSLFMESSSSLHLPSPVGSGRAVCPRRSSTGRRNSPLTTSSSLYSAQSRAS